MLTFDQDGLPGPDPVRCHSQVLKERVVKSIAFYSLDDGVLNGRRADMWRQVLGWSEEIEILMAEAGPLSVAQEERLRIRGGRGWNAAVLNAAD